MTHDKETAVRMAAKAYHEAFARVRGLEMMNTPTDYAERLTAFEELEMARADAQRALNRLTRAKAEYANDA